MIERRLDVAESRRAFALGQMKALGDRPAFEPSGLWESPGHDAWSASARRELARRARLERWQVPRV